MSGVKSQGSTLKISVPGSPSVLALVAQVTDYKLAGAAGEIDFSDLDSEAFRGKTGLPKFNFSGTLNFDPNLPRHQECSDALASGVALEAQLSLPSTPAVTYTFQGYLQNWEIGGSVDGKVVMSFGILIDGKPVRA